MNKNKGEMIKCNHCGKLFSMLSLQIQEVTEGDLVCTWLQCPICGGKYLILATDTIQRDLIEKRKKLVNKINLGREKNFRAKTIQGYHRELNKIKDEQGERAEELRAKGEKLLGITGKEEENDRG